MAEQSAGGGLMKKLLSLVVVVVLGALGYGKYGGQGDKPGPEAPQGGTATTKHTPVSRGDTVPAKNRPSAKPAPKPKPAPRPKTTTTDSGADRLAAKRRELTESAGRIEKLYHDKKSKVWVSVEGLIVHKLPDDNEGSRHQLCLLELITGHTLKISHNIDLAPYIPWQKGDTLSIRGRYEWNDRGGVVHWTHHDPKGRIEGGWIDHKGKRYE